MSQNKNDLYALLNVSTNATVEEIRKAYKKLALQLHPDKNQGNSEEAEKNFKEVTQAYNVLSDPQKRQMYDQFGTVEDVHSGAPGHDMNDILNNLFGSAMGGGPSTAFGGPFSFMFGQDRGMPNHPHGGQANPDTLHVEITLDEVCNGTRKNISFEVQDKCSQCDATGAEDPSDIIKCVKCGGKGMLTQQIGPMFLSTSMCPSCFGQCTMIKSNKHCTRCKGSKRIAVQRSLDVKVPKGIKDKTSHCSKGAGSYNLQTKSHADLVITFMLQIPKDIRIDSHGNVFMNMNVKMEELLCGFKKHAHLYGKPFVFQSNGYFNPTKNFVVQDAGLPVLGRPKNGNLVVDFKIIYPEDSSKVNKYTDVLCKVFKKTAALESNEESMSDKKVFIIE
jgi:molecular chaperone DnaJ